MSRPSTLPMDHSARTRAATDFSTNLVVSAGAGTGKTTLLIERLLTALGGGKASLSEIAAITFTDKAAGELRERLAIGLQELATLALGGFLHDRPSAAKTVFDRLTESSLATPADIGQRAVAAEAKLDRATVTTIHGFCSEILRAHPMVSGLPPDYVVDRGLTGRRLAEQAWTAFVEDELGPDGSRAELWERALRVFSLNELASIGRALAGGSISDEALAGDVAVLDLHAAIGDLAERLANEIQEAIGRTEGLTKAPRTWLEEAEATLRAFAAGGTEAGRSVLQGASRLSDRMPDVYTRRVAEAQADALWELEKRALPLLRGIRDANAKAEEDLFAVLLPFVRRLRSQQSRSGLVDFDGLLVRVRDILRRERSVREALKRRFRIILVDEFQDTDPVQYEIVFFLAEREGDDAQDAYRTRLSPGRLFIVGDAKQSIYRFRGADFSAYRRAVEHVVAEGGSVLPLTSNFRATPAVLRPVNALFAEPGSTIWRASDYLPPYESIEAEREDDRACAVEVWTTTAGPDVSADDRRRAEGLALAAELSAIAGPGRTWEYKDVLILLRGLTEVAPYLRALRDARIPFVVSGGRTFHERTEIVQALAVLRAVADPGDAVALLAYRRSPAGGVPDTELAAAAATSPGSLLSAADLRLATLRAATRDLPVDAAVRHVLEASGLFALSGLAFEGAQRVANLDKLVSAASELSRDGRLTMAETLDALEDSFESGEEGDSPLTDSERDAVRVMSIHRAKGLEAKVVILADTAADRGNRPRTRFTARMARLTTGQHVALEGPKFRNGAAIAASLDEAQHDAAEEVRLLYVALTRARDRLFVFGGGHRKSAWTTALSAWSTGVTRRILAEPPRRPAEGSPSIGAPSAAARFEAAVGAIAALAAPPFRSPSDDTGPASAFVGGLAPALAREVGRIVHAKLADMETPDGGETQAEAELVLREFNRSPLASRLATLDVLGREVPLLFSEEDARWRGAIDLLYRDGDGTIVIADYKTDASDEGAIERHRRQLEVYARAVARAMPAERVRAELWMLRSGRILPIGPGGSPSRKAL